MCTQKTKMTKTNLNKNPFLAILKEYTPEQWAKMEQRQQSKDAAENYLKQFFGLKASRVIIANIMVEGRKVKKTGFLTFDEAWDALDYFTITDIIFRTISGLPCKEKDTGEARAYQKKRLKKGLTSCKN